LTGDKRRAMTGVMHDRIEGVISAEVMPAALDPGIRTASVPPYACRRRSADGKHTTDSIRACHLHPNCEQASISVTAVDGGRAGGEEADIAVTTPLGAVTLETAEQPISGLPQRTS